MVLPKILTAAAGVATGAGAMLLRELQKARVPGTGRAPVQDDPKTSVRRWRAVTILCSPEEVATGDALPEPLTPFRDRIEIRVTPAPADKGTELAARFRGQTTQDDIGELRSALRRAKQLIEVGEVLRVEPQPHGRRKDTPQGELLEKAAAEAPKGGVL
jgi:uncharacterized protein (DUF1778 family)